MQHYCNNFNKKILQDTWHLLPKCHHERRTVVKNRTRRCSHDEEMKEVKMDRPRLEKGRTYQHQNGHEAKCSGEKENKKTKAIMETHSDKQAGQHWEDTG